jgi:hypothetical protein
VPTGNASGERRAGPRERCVTYSRTRRSSLGEQRVGALPVSQADVGQRLGDLEIECPGINDAYVAYSMFAQACSYVSVQTDHTHAATNSSIC